MNNNQVKLKRIIVLILALVIIPNLLVSNQGNIEISIDEKNTNEVFTPQPPRVSSVYYEATTGNAMDVYVSGDYAYVADYDSGLAIIDISDPTNPGTPIYENTTGIASSVYVSGNYAYIADELSGLAIIDISDPTNPGTPIYEDTSGSASGVYVSGNYAYVADWSFGLAVINISDPINPGTPVYEDTTGGASDIYVSGDYAYVADWSSGLAIINISDPTNPGTPVYEPTNGDAFSVYVSGDYAYVAVGNWGLAIINISNPTNPGTPVYEFTTGYARGVYVSGDYAYVADWSSGLAIINISDPTNPGAPIYEDTIGSAFKVYVSGDYAYLANGGSGLAVIAITYPIDPGTPIYEDTTGWAYDVYVSGDYAYVADYGSGLAVIDISDPTNPGTPVYEATTGVAFSVYVSGDYAYVADDASGLAVIDISDPTNPGTPVYEDTSGYAWGVFVSGDYAYVADASSGLAVIDISDPTNPGAPVYEATTGIAFNVYVSGDYAYVAAYGAGLAVIDISDPTNPGAPVYKATSGSAYDVYVSGDYAYVGDMGSGLAVIDISDPTNPGTPVYEATTGFAKGVYVSGDYAYVAGDIWGLAVFNISDPTNPGAPVYEDTSGRVYGVYVSGDYAYVADYISGLAVIQIRKRVDMVNPLITNTPSDFTIEYGTTGVNISWTATDSNPNNYTIELQGNGTVAGPSAWSSGVAVSHNVPDGLAIGEYFYTVNFTDDYDNYITDTVKLTVTETVDPLIINAPSDFTVDFGYTGVNISWTATDVYPNNYTIELQGNGIVAGPSAWSNGTAITYNVPDGLAIGEYFYTVNFTDDYDNYITDTVKLTVTETVDPLIINAPSDFTVDFGYTGVNISWTATDVYPNNYTIELQGIGKVVSPSVWSNGTAITYNVPDGLAVGEYFYIINFTDDNNNYITDTVKMTVRETVDPLITNAPSDFTVDYGYTGVHISWTATDVYPNNYTIELQGIGTVAGPNTWSSGVAITYNVPDGIAVGEYFYIINFTDDYGNHITDTVKMTVRETVDPLITDAPSDFTIDFGYTGVHIYWTATDSNPNIYTIELQGNGTVAGPNEWSNGGVIIYNVPNGLTVGEHFYTVNFTDDYDNYITDTVKMTVREVTTGGNGGAISFGNYYLIFLVIGIISLAIVQKRRKQSSYH